MTHSAVDAILIFNAHARILADDAPFTSIAIGDMHDDITYFRPRLLMVSLHHSYHRKCIDFDDHQCYFLKMLASYSSHSYLQFGNISAYVNTMIWYSFN